MMNSAGGHGVSVTRGWVAAAGDSSFFGMTFKSLRSGAMRGSSSSRAYPGLYPAGSAVPGLASTLVGVDRACNERTDCVSTLDAPAERSRSPGDGAAAGESLSLPLTSLGMTSGVGGMTWVVISASWRRMVSSGSSTGSFQPKPLAIIHCKYPIQIET